eukprot:4667093-Pleurochrysis_carterae.AAC.2
MLMLRTDPEPIGESLDLRSFCSVLASATETEEPSVGEASDELIEGDMSAPSTEIATSEGRARTSAGLTNSAGRRPSSTADLRRLQRTWISMTVLVLGLVSQMREEASRAGRRFRCMHVRARRG